MPLRKIDFIEKAGDVSAERVKGKLAAAADVLRATSTIVTALQNGCREVIPAATVEEALEISSHFPKDDILLGGERGGKRIPGFHLGNSPKEYQPESVGGRRVITTTTNGTRALINAAAARETVVLAFLNLASIVDRLRRHTADICLIAAGNAEAFSIEDTVCCGQVILNLVRSSPDAYSLTPAAEAAAQKAQKWEGRTLQLLESCPHGKFLQEIGFGSDLPFCAEIDKFAITPVFRHRKVRILS